jgi:GT2 family glycosyltransferase
VSGRVSAVIATRNRGAKVEHAVRSILANEPPVHEVIVVDQSNDDSTEAALQPLLAETDVLRYRRLPEPGLSRARNDAIRDAVGEYLAITDSAWEQLGGFDEMLGPGGAFPGGDEGDFAIRALAAGWCMLEPLDRSAVLFKPETGQRRIPA